VVITTLLMPRHRQNFGDRGHAVGGAGSVEMMLCFAGSYVFSLTRPAMVISSLVAERKSGPFSLRPPLIVACGGSAVGKETGGFMTM